MCKVTKEQEMAKFNINDEIVFIEEAHKEHPKITRIVQVGADE